MNITVLSIENLGGNLDVFEVITLDGVRFRSPRGAMFRTDRGWKPVERLKAGFEIIGFDVTSVPMVNGLDHDG